MGAAMEQDEEEWREEEEASSAVETGCCSSQSIPVFAHALSLLNSFPTPPHDTLFSAVPNPEEAAEATGILACGSVQQEEQHQNGQQQHEHQQQKQQIPVEPCARNEEDKAKSNTHNSSSEQHKKIRSKNWTRLEMLKLVRLRTDYEPKFAGGGKKMELWDEISEGLNREGISRDGQQCRDKWEKLCAGYKDVRDGSKLKEDFAMFDVLHPLLSGKIVSKKMIEINGKGAAPGNGSQQEDHHCDHQQNPTTVFENFYEDEVLDGSGGNAGAAASARAAPAPRKKRKLLKYVPLTDVAVVQNLLENLVARQQRFFRDLLESMERREQIREQIRQEREEQWRAEDRAQRNAFNNAMICLTQKLVGDNKGGGLNLGLNNLQQQQYGKNNNSSLQHQQLNISLQQPVEGVKKRSKNWKRAEVLQLIKLRGEMETQFSSGTRKTAVWDELSELLMAQGIARDGKQCREKWDKLTAAYKDVTDGVKDSADMPYFAELSVALRKPGNLEESKTNQQAPASVALEEVLPGTEVLNGGQALPVDCR